MSNELFRKIATNYYYYNEISEEERLHKKLNFYCSNHFISKFQERNGMSQRRADLKRRPDMSNEVQNSEQTHIESLKQFLLIILHTVMKLFGGS